MHRYQPKSASLVPAMIQMILQAHIKPKPAAQPEGPSARGTAPLDPQIQAAIRGSVRHPDTHRLRRRRIHWRRRRLGALRITGFFSQIKRGSVGRRPARRAVEGTPADSEAELPPGHSGVLHIKSTASALAGIGPTIWPVWMGTGFFFGTGRGR